MPDLKIKTIKVGNSASDSAYLAAKYDVEDNEITQTYATQSAVSASISALSASIETSVQSEVQSQLKAGVEIVQKRKTTILTSEDGSGSILKNKEEGYNNYLKIIILSTDAKTGCNYTFDKASASLSDSSFGAGTMFEMHQGVLIITAPNGLRTVSTLAEDPATYKWDHFEISVKEEETDASKIEALVYEEGWLSETSSSTGSGSTTETGGEE